MKRESSYITNNYKNVFATSCFLVNPKKIVEFGILDGYSLSAFLDSRPSGCVVEAYDLFDDFPYNAANYEDVVSRFSSRGNILIKKMDFFKGASEFENGSIDILHIDIANNGDIYQFAVDNYMDKVSENGICILEGGSEERDNYDWMIKYEKKKIKPYLNSLQGKYDVMVMNDFPSITIIKKHNNEKA
jgi:hypothetical protein